MSKILQILKLAAVAIVRPLASRKVRVAMATVIAAYAGQYGLGVSESVVFTILGVGAAVILGIAHEDSGQKSAGTPASRLSTLVQIIRAVRGEVSQSGPSITRDKLENPEAIADARRQG
jgi:hypothetical protein